MITGSAWKNSVNAATGGIGILINNTSFNYLVNVTLVSKRIMIVNFNGNPLTSIIVCYSPTNVSDPMEIENFYDILNSATKQEWKGQLWKHKSPNGNKIQIDYIMINRKWKNSSKKCRDYGILKV